MIDSCKERNAGYEDRAEGRAVDIDSGGTSLAERHDASLINPNPSLGDLTTRAKKILIIEICLVTCQPSNRRLQNNLPPLPTRAKRLASTPGNVVRCTVII